MRVIDWHAVLTGASSTPGTYEDVLTCTGRGYNGAWCERADWARWHAGDWRMWGLADTKLWRAPSADEVDLKRSQSVLVHVPVRGNAKLCEGIAQSVAATKCQDGLNPAFVGPLRRDPSDRCDASVALERRLSTRAACRREIHPRDARGYAWFFQALRWRCRVRCDRCHLLVWDSTQVTAAGAITRSPCKAPPCPPTCILKTPTSMACRAHPSPATGSATLDRNDVSVYSQH